MPRRPDVPCASCGALMWSATTSLPPGQRMCRPCRKVRREAVTANVTRRPRRPPVERPCAWCAEPFTVTKDRKRYCSRECGSQWKRPTLTVIPWCTCLTCRGWFIARRGRRYCPACPAPVASYYQPTPPVTAECEQCGKEFTWQGPGRPRLFCSKSCRESSPRAKAARRRSKSTRRARLRGAERESFDPHEVFERDQWRCHLCGKRTDRTKVAPSPRAPTLDHVIPLSKGGAHTRANTRCACSLCNSLKGDRVLHPEQLALIG